MYITVLYEVKFDLGLVIGSFNGLKIVECDGDLDKSLFTERIKEDWNQHEDVYSVKIIDIESFTSRKKLNRSVDEITSELICDWKGFYGAKSWHYYDSLSPYNWQF